MNLDLDDIPLDCQYCCGMLVHMTTITATTPAPLVDTDDDSGVILPDDIAANARELNDVRAALKVLNDREDILKKKVRAFLEGANVDAATDGTVTAFRSSHDRSGVDAKRLEALYPSVYEGVKTSTPVVRIWVEVKSKG